MTRHYKLTLAAFALLLSALIPVVANAQLAPTFVRPRLPNETPAPKVVFVGDYITYQWASAFAANPNWINQGNPAPIGAYIYETVNMANVISLHPAAVHILIGLPQAAQIDDASQQIGVPAFLNYINYLVQQAKAADIQVILGLEPPLVGAEFLSRMNAAIASYGAAYNIPVINYEDALCNCVSSLGAFSVGGDNFQQYGGGPFTEQGSAAVFSETPAVPWDNDLVITPTGYNLMTQMAESTINTMNLKLVTGWLSDVEQPNEITEGYPSNVNTVTTPAVVQFTPIGYYSDGSQHPMLNTNLQGASGTWTSSNPLVMYVNQKGLAWAISAGTARISYTAPNGLAFSPWVMYVNTNGEGGPVAPCCTSE